VVELSKVKKARSGQSNATDNASLITGKIVVCIIGLGYVGLPIE
jgi:UDP-N-acetyl-D-mannosaminuronate dehydrogenase